MTESVPFFTRLLIVFWLSCGLFVKLYAQKPDSIQSKNTTDTIIISGKKYPFNEINSELISEMSYEELVSLPFDALVKLSDLLEMSIDDMLKMKTSVSSKAASTVREQPNILTVITEEQIEKSGFHDLMSILQMVPGIFFGSDVSGVIGIGMRGIWAQEGKILLLIDGQELNEPRYSSMSFLNHISVEQIKRIEIIRGSGSSLWGGSAEMGVINIITKLGRDINGLNVSTVGSYLKDTYGRENVSFAAGKKINDLDISMAAYYGRAHKNTKTYNSFYFKNDDPENGLMKYDMSGHYGLTDSRNVNLGISWKNLFTRFIYDYYKVWGIDEEIYDVSFETFACELKYNWHIIPEKLYLQPKINLKYSVPWYTEGWYGNENILRNRISLSAVCEPHPVFTATGGAEIFIDNIEYENNDLLFYNNHNSINYKNKLLYLEGLLKFGKLKITTGGRIEHNDQYGFAFAPRAGLNQVIGNFHYKILYSKAFRAPGIGNLEKNPEIDPEKTSVLELEGGYKFKKYMFLTANVFDIRIKDPIFYLQGDTFWDYRNGSHLGSSGFELEYAVRHPRITATANYSFYQMHRANSIDKYESSLNKNAFLGAPQHKIALFGFYNLSKHLSIHSSLRVLSNLYGFVSSSIEQESEDDISTRWILPIEKSLDPSIQFNAGFNVNNLFSKGLQLSFGVNDIFNEAMSLVQPYNGYEAPLSGMGREFYFKLKYQFQFKK